MGAALLDGFTVSGGYSTVSDGGNITVNSRTFIQNYGAGITCDCAMTFSNITVKNNTGYLGGGLCFTGTGFTVTNTLLHGNTANGAGGGLYMYGGTNYLTNLTFANNKSAVGGAMRVAVK